MLKQRELVPEDMDDPELSNEGLQGALTGLTRINFISDSARIVWSPIKKLANELRLDRLRVLDIATGAGDVPRALWHRSRRAGIALEIHGIDFSPRSIEFARRRAEELKTPVTFTCQNVLTHDLPADYDVIMCSLFLHHLTNEDATLLLRRMAIAARQLVLVNDLRRCWYGLVLAQTVSRAITRCNVVHVDAVRSVRAAFTTAEFEQMAVAAGLAGATITRYWPARMLLTWQALNK